jgi:O-antigen/teichoic acid export membrane protein
MRHILFIVFVDKNEIHFDFRFLTLKTLTLNSKFLILHIAILPFVAFIDSYFVEKYLTGQDLGLYSFSLKVYSISLLLFAPILTVLNVKQIEIAKEKSYLLFLKKNLKKVFVLSTILLIVVVIINLVITQYIYLDYKNSFLDTSILLLAAYVSYISMPFSFLIAYRKYKQLFRINRRYIR